MNSEPAEPEHEWYGPFEDEPRCKIEMSFEEWSEVARTVLQRNYGPPIAWEYSGGVLHLWGDNLDDEILSKASKFCPDVKDEHDTYGMYDLVRAAERVEQKFNRAEVVR